MTKPNEGTGAGLLEFLDWASRKGEINPSTASSWSTACRRVLAIDDSPEDVDLRQLDIERFLDRFENLHRTDYSTGSLETYKSRFRQATNAYLGWLANDPSWKPARRILTRKKPGTAATSQKAREDQQTKIEGAASPPQPPQHGGAPRLIAYTIPLRPSLMVDLTLPVDLSSADAERIATFVRSLAFASEPEEKPHKPGE
jgi:hypothetical protein